MNDRIGRTAERHQNAQRILDGFLGDQTIGRDRIADQRDREATAFLGGDETIGVNGRDRCAAWPKVSAMQAIVLAVPITAQVPAVTASRPSTSAISSASVAPARKLAQNRRQSVHAPSRSPRWRPVDMAPTTSWTAGRPAEAAPISWAGTVLSQPPISTTASMGWARIISSTSIAIKLR